MLRPGIEPDTFHRLQAGSLPDRYGFEVTRIEAGRLDARFEVQPWMMAPNGYLHAASVIVLADTLCGYGTIAHLPDSAKGFTTLELKSNFLGTALQGVIRAEATAEHLGRTTHVWSATVFGPEGRRLALFRCTQMVLY